MEPIVIARAPLSISLGERGVGGGPGDPGRLGFRAAVNSYAYTIITAGSSDGVQIIWAGCPAFPSCHQDDRTLSETVLDLPEVISRRFNVRDGLTIFLAPQVPFGVASGLVGSLAVSMIKALAFCSGIDLDPTEVAELACSVGTELSATNSRSWDSYASAYGGLTSVEVGSNRSRTEVLQVSSTARRTLERSLMLFRTHHRTQGTTSTSEPRSGWPREAILEAELTEPALGARAPREWAVHMRSTLEGGDLTALGQLLHHAWMAESCAPGRASDTLVDRCYWAAKECGALGGRAEKGGGYGLLALVCREEDQPSVNDALTELGMVRWPMRLDYAGVEVLEAVPRTWSKLMARSSLFSSV